MKCAKIFFVTCFILFCFSSQSQNTFVATVKNDIAKQPLQGASVQIKNLHLSAIANDEGVIILKNIPNGKYDVGVSSVGFKEIEKEFGKSIECIQ